MLHAGKIATVRRTPWVRIRYQLGGGLLFAALLPYLTRLIASGPDAALVGLDESLAGTVLAVIAGYYIFRQLVMYPGVKASRHILPTFSIAFGTVVAAFLILRIDYSRAHFLSSFILCLGWFFLVYFKAQKGRGLILGVVPCGEWHRLKEVSGLDLVILSDPRANTDPIDGVVADLRSDLPDEWERFLADRALEGKLVMHVKQVEETLTGRVSIEHLSENSLGSLLPGILYDRVKRTGDILISLAAMPFVILICAVAALMVRLDSPGPVFFVQERVGYRGRLFRMYKFRTMRAEPMVAAPSREAAKTVDGDRRVTRVGRVLRKYRIDEIPQIVNILRGEMSWIGPRPEAVPLSQWYEAELPFYRYRHIVRPGITGWAQVKQGHVAEVDEVLGKLQYDFYYVKNFGFWLDVLILAATVRIIMSGFGAK